MKRWVDSASSAAATRGVEHAVRVRRPGRSARPSPATAIWTYSATVCERRLEVGRLLLREVVVEAVDDEHRDEQQGQHDDRDEGDGQAALERAGHEPAHGGARASVARSRRPLLGRVSVGSAPRQRSAKA